MGLAFFGLTQEYRLQLFQQLHEIVFHGNGGYDWDTVYNFPIWLRRYTFQSIKEHYENKNNTQQKEKTAELLRPQIDPTYNTKASIK